jgi:hypothetical protein
MDKDEKQITKNDEASVQGNETTDEKVKNN